jgi:hypothetical protein
MPRRLIQEVTVSKTLIAIAVASLALVSTGASAQVGFRIGGGGIGIGLGVPLYGGQERPRNVERYRAPQRTDRVQRRRNNDDDDVKTAKKTPEETTARNENSSIVTIGSDKDKSLPVTEQQKTDLAKSDKSRSNNENSAIATVASSATAVADSAKGAVTKADTDGAEKTVATCKRYFPTAGQTITVPCD